MAIRYEIKDKNGVIIASNLPENYKYSVIDLNNRIKKGVCPITGEEIRQGYFETENGLIYIASSNIPSNKLFKRYFESCDFFIPVFTKKLNLSITKTRSNFRRFKHNLISHHTNVIQELESIFPIENSEKGVNNQINFIANILKEDLNRSAKSLLKVIKSVNLMKSEFDVYDMLNTANPNLEFYSHSPHKLVRLVISPFWLDFMEKNIFIDIQECDKLIVIDFKSISVVLSHIFENATKYIINDSVFSISFKEIDSFIEICFNMISLKIKKEEKDKIFTEEFSGDFAKEMLLDGDGIGMSVVKKLVEINNGTVSIDIDISDEDRRTNILGVPYERNIFRIKFPKASA